MAATGSGRRRTAARADLDVVVEVVVRGGRGPTAVAGGHPPAALECVPKRLDVLGALAQHGLVHVAGHVVDAERADALGASVGALAAVSQDLAMRVHLVQVVPVLIALRLPSEAVRVRAHLFALAGEVPLTLGAQPFA